MFVRFVNYYPTMNRMIALVLSGSIVLSQYSQLGDVDIAILVVLPLFRRQLFPAFPPSEDISHQRRRSIR